MRLFENQKQNKYSRFEQVVLSQQAAAYNLARWLTHNDQDAEDIVQEAFLRAFKYFDGFHGENCRPWLLKIVRNTFYTRIQPKGQPGLTTCAHEEIEIENIGSDEFDPERLLQQSAGNQLVREALWQLPVEFREVIILRELEGFSYKEIAELAGIPVGTVMSRLARGRQHLQRQLTIQMNKDL